MHEKLVKANLKNLGLVAEHTTTETVLQRGVARGLPVLIPMINGNHYRTLIMDTQNKELVLYDSMSGGSWPDHLIHQARAAVDRLGGGWQLRDMMYSPQEDGWSCGLWTRQFGQSLRAWPRPWAPSSRHWP